MQSRSVLSATRSIFAAVSFGGVQGTSCRSSAELSAVAVTRSKTGTSCGQATTSTFT